MLKKCWFLSACFSSIPPGELRDIIWNLKIFQLINHPLVNCTQSAHWQNLEITHNRKITLHILTSHNIDTTQPRSTIACMLLRINNNYSMELSPSWEAIKKQTNSVALRPEANYTDWATATCRRNLVPTFVDRRVSRGQRGGSPTVVNLRFVDRSRYLRSHQPFKYWRNSQDFVELESSLPYSQKPLPVSILSQVNPVTTILYSLP
jgi:hypothetical protein